jgi:hypothetical protein
VNTFSLTITKTNADISRTALDIMDAWIQEHCLKGAIATEVGKRKFQLHLQAVIKMHYPTTRVMIFKLSKEIKSQLPDKGKGHKVGLLTSSTIIQALQIILKACAHGQTFAAMVGYVTKDAGKPHHDLRSHNLSPQELSIGKREHAALLTSIDDDKKVVNMRNLVNECYRFNQRCLWPAIVPPQYCLLYMIQSGGYILSPDFIACARKIDLREMEALWTMVHTPQKVTVDMVLKLVFDPRSYGFKPANRYFLASIHSVPEATELQEDRTPQTSQESSDAVEGGRSRVERMIDICRSRPIRDTQPDHPTDDFTPLPPEEDPLFTIDTEGEDIAPASQPVSFTCPDNLEDMMTIVRDLRDQRQRVLSGFTYENNHVVRESRGSKRGYESGRCPNLSDF